ERAAATPDPLVRDGILRDALALWRGPALYGAVDDELRERLCTDLEELRLRAVEESLAVGMELGRQQDVIARLARLTAEYPLRERLVELHVRALHRDGTAARPRRWTPTPGSARGWPRRSARNRVPRCASCRPRSCA